MRQDIIDALQKELVDRCGRESNQFGMGIYWHIEAVARNAAYLAREYGGDEEISTIAGWLHDLAAVTDPALYEEHHLHGAKMAGAILESFGYEPDRIERVQECIRRHRGSALMEKRTIEELCVADADAVSHFDSVPSLLYMVYVKKGMGIEEGAQWVKRKLERSYAKLSARSRELYREKYERAMSVLG